jgi:hypothetical protein
VYEIKAEVVIQYINFIWPQRRRWWWRQRIESFLLFLSLFTESIQYINSIGSHFAAVVVAAGCGGGANGVGLWLSLVSVAFTESKLSISESR